MDCAQRPDESPTPARGIDYQQAAERLLVVLSFLCFRPGDSKKRHPMRPVPAGRLCTCIFPADLHKHWTHESKRRRVREAATIARKYIAERHTVGGSKFELVANGQGYWLTGDLEVMTWYAGQRRRRGIRDLVEAKKVEAAVDAAGQRLLFNAAPPPGRPV